MWLPQGSSFLFRFYFRKGSAASRPRESQSFGWLMCCHFTWAIAEVPGICQFWLLLYQNQRPPHSAVSMSAHMLSLSKPWRIHPHSGMGTVVTVRSSINTDGRLTDSGLGFGASSLWLGRLNQHVHGQGKEYHWNGTTTDVPFSEWYHL